MNRKNAARAISRRQFLKSMGVAGASIGLAGALPALARPRRQDAVELSWWWWADFPEFGRWVEDTAAKFSEQHDGVTVTTLEQATDAVIPAFTAAAAAGEPPDVAFLFNGLYHMENVWLGYLDPLDPLIPTELIQASNATVMSRYNGQYYRVGWYPVPLLWEYNKDVWDQAGLDADNPPRTWGEWMAAADALKTAGFTPFGGGISDGFWGEWYLGNALTQSLDSPRDAIELFIGEKDFRDPRYHEFWVRLEEMVKAGFMNDDMLSIDLFTAINKVVTGELATTQNVGSVIPAHIPELGDRIGQMIMPVFGTGALAGRAITDTQGFGIPSASRNKELAAEVLIYTQDPERLNAFWEINNYFPSNKNWDASVIEDPVLRYQWDTWVGGDTIIYIPDLMPTLFWTDAMFVSAQEIIAGNMTGEEAGEQNAQIAEQWRQLNPDLIENYQAFAEGLGEAESAVETD